MTYIDGFVIKFPAKNFAAYKKMALLGRKIWMKHGALQYVEAIGDDLGPAPTGPSSKIFTKLTKAKPDDVVLFSFIVFPFVCQQCALTVGSSGRRAGAA